MFDFRPATTVLASLVEGVRDDQLAAPTPCEDVTLGDLLDHIDNLARGFTAAANKTRMPGDQTPRPDASRLGSDWRTRIPGHLDALAEAWREPAAWEGMTQAGGIDLPGEVAAVVALDEVFVHGWDVAAASGQAFAFEPGHLEVAHGFVQRFADQNPEGVPGMFAAPVTVPDDAPPLSRFIGLTGRDPAWHA